MLKQATTVLLLILALLPRDSSAQDPQLTRMLFVMDASNSMNAFWDNRPKINTARDILLKALDELDGQDHLEIGLRLYGHQTAIKPGQQDCNDTRLEVPFSKDGPTKIRHVLNSVLCQGTTPIARSLEKAANDFPDCSNCRNVIILITDGIEACDEDPCAVSRALQAKGIILKPFVIGIGLDGQAWGQLKCVGNYYDASTAEMFDHVLKVVITQALNSTTAQLNLNTVDGEPTETNVPITFYDEHSGAIRYNFVHTMNHRGLPDTLSIDPIETYRIVAHTIPPVVRTGVKLSPGIHNIISMDAGQGVLELQVGSGGNGNGLQAVVHQNGKDAILHVQELGTKEEYLVGIYDLEILTLPRMFIEDITIAQSNTETVRIPESGGLNLILGKPGFGALFKVTGEDLEWVVDIDPERSQSQFTLLPGDYRILYRSGTSKNTEYTKEQDFSIRSGTNHTIKL